MLDMHKITTSTILTSPIGVLPTTRVTKIRHGRKFRVYRPCGIPPTIQSVESTLSIFLVFEPCVHIPNEMVVFIVAYVHLLQFPIQTQLGVEIFVKGIEVLLDLGGGEFCAGDVLGVLVEVSAEDGLRVGWFDVFSVASVAVEAGADFEVE
jgi:hypothetical protein